MKKILLFLPALLISSAIFAQTFTFSFTSNDTMGGQPGMYIGITGKFFNNSSTGYYIDMIKDEKNIPPTWKTTICADVCQPYWVDSADVYLLPNDSQNFVFTFETDTFVTGQGDVLLRFKNTVNPSNTFIYRVAAYTDFAFSVNEPDALQTLVVLSSAFIPKGSSVCFSVSPVSGIPSLQVELYDLSGKFIQSEFISGGNTCFAPAFSSPGMYLYRIVNQGGLLWAGKMVAE